MTQSTTPSWLDDIIVEAQTNFLFQQALDDKIQHDEVISEDMAELVELNFAYAWLVYLVMWRAIGVGPIRSNIAPPSPTLTSKLIERMMDGTYAPPSYNSLAGVCAALMGVSPSKGPQSYTFVVNLWRDALIDYQVNSGLVLSQLKRVSTPHHD